MLTYSAYWPVSGALSSHPLHWLSSGYFEKLRAFCTQRTHLGQDSDVLICTFAAGISFKRPFWTVARRYIWAETRCTFSLMTWPVHNAVRVTPAFIFFTAEGYIFGSDALTFLTDRGEGEHISCMQILIHVHTVSPNQAHIFWWTRIYFESVSSKRKLDAWAFIFCTSFPYLLSRSDPNFKRGKGKDTDMGAAYYFWLYNWLFSFETLLLDM